MKSSTTKFLFGLLCSFLLFNYSAQGQQVVLLGSANTMSDLPAGEQNAYSWAKSVYGENAKYMSFSDIAADGLPKEARTIWYHYEDTSAVPVSDPAANATIDAFIADGGGILTSGFATNYVLDINVTTVGTSETIDKDPAGPDAAWGIRPFTMFRNHPVFKGITANNDWADPNWSGFRTISDSVAGREAMSWWTMNSYPGTGIAAMPWFSGEDLPVIGFIPYNKGKAMTCTAPGYHWKNASINGVNEQTKLERLTQNMLEWVGGIGSKAEIVMIGAGNTVADLPPAEQNAYNWALGYFGKKATYMSFQAIAEKGLPINTESVWYHFEEDPVLPVEDSLASQQIQQFIENGGGFLTSAFATEYILSTGGTTIAPTETIDKDSAGPDVAWGIRPFPNFTDDVAFAGIMNNTDWADPNWMGFRTISDSVAGREAIRWWTGNTYPGIGIAAMPWFAGLDLPVIGYINQGEGTNITCTAPGYHWKNAPQNGSVEQAKLERLTANLLRRLSGPTILMVGDSSSVSQLPNGEKQAYQWAIDAYGADAQYRSWEEVSNMGIENTVKTVWFHKEDNPILSTEADLNSDAKQQFVFERGGAMLLTGFATQYLHVIDTNFTATSETIDKDPAGPDAAWGIRPFPSKDQHPIFAGILNNTDWADPSWSGFRTISDSVAGREAISWWTANSYPGTGLAAMPWFSGEDLPVIGEIFYGNGGFITCAAPGYNWVSADSNGINEQNNLELLTKNMLDYTLSYQEEQAIFVSLMGGGNEINEDEEDGKVIMVSFENVVLNDTINPSNWTVSNLPGNITFTLDKVDDTNATLTLAGTSDDYMDTNINDFAVEVAKAEFINLRDTSLLDCGSIIFVADTTTDTATNIELLNGNTIVEVYPNPFDEHLVFEYDLKSSQRVSLKLMDLSGRTLKVLADEVQVNGKHELRWNSSNVPTGVYLYRLTIGEHTKIGKLIKQ